MREAQHPRADGSCHAGGREHPPKNAGRRHNEQHRGGGLYGVQANLDKHFQVQGAVPKKAQNQSPHASGNGPFGGREDAGDHAANQEHRRHDGQHSLEVKDFVGSKQQDQSAQHRPLRVQAKALNQPPHQQGPAHHHAGLGQRFEHARPTEFGIGTPIVFMGKVSHGGHHQQGHQHAGQDARQEQRAHRHVGHHAVDHKGQAWWNDGPQGSRCCRHANRKFSAVAMVFHGLDFDGAQARGVSDGGATHAGKHY